MLVLFISIAKHVTVTRHITYFYSWHQLRITGILKNNNSFEINKKKEGKQKKGRTGGK